MLLFRILKNLLFPPRCIFCRRLLTLTADKDFCAECFESLPFCLAYPRCTRCGRPVLTGVTLCEHCQKGSVYFRGVSAPYLYEGLAKQAVLRFKQERYRGFADVFAEHIEAVLHNDCGALAFDLVVAVPPRKMRLRKEGYDQAAELARVLAKRLKLPYLSGVMRQRMVREKQSGLSAEERQRNIAGNIEAIKAKAVVGKRILLVDDVCTTGATLRECAKVLRRAGAKSVYGAVAATVSNRL